MANENVDGKVRIGTAIDETGLDKGLASVGKKLQEGAKVADSYLGKMAKIGLAATGAGLAIKKVGDVVNDLTDAYKGQFRAETQLEQAAKNNPYLTDEAVQRLKEYAGQLQVIAGVGDEEIIPFMAQLANAQRSQAEIQDIITTSLDIAASGTMSFESAVRNLNKTFGGYGGELSEAIPAIKDLTSEQLKQGGAVKLLAERYKGMAAEVNRNVGSSADLANAFGDLKEQLGEPFEQGLAPMRGWFTALFAGWTEGIKKLNEYRRAQKELHEDPSNINAQLLIEQKAIADIDKKYTNIAGQLANMSDVAKQGIAGQALRDQLESLLAQREARAQIVSELETQIRKEAALAAAEKETDKNDANKSAEAQKLADYLDGVAKAREKAVQQLQLQAEAEGRQVDRADLLNAYASSYVSLISESDGLVTQNSAAAQDLLAILIRMSREYDTHIESQDYDLAQKEALKKKAEELRQTILQAVAAIDDDKPQSERMKAQLAELDGYYQQVAYNEQISADQQLEIYREYTEGRKLLLADIAKAEKEEADEAARHRKEKTLEMLQTAADFAAQYQNIMTSIQALATQTIEAEAKVKTAKVEEQYAAGAISAEEYEAKLEEISKEAAERKYKVDMWVWSANILSAVANTALAATKALSEGGAFAGPLLAAMITAAGGIQLATIIGNKPIPPSFATGGIEGGTSYTGDKRLALINSREMMLNPGQQRNLFDRINEGSLGGATPQVSVYNYASNDVRVDTSVSGNDVIHTIRHVTGKDIENGTYNKQLKSAQGRMHGVRYTT